MSFLDLLRRRDRELDVQTDSFRFGTVQTLSPFTVRLDGDLTENTPAINLVQGVQVGERVWCQLHGRQHLAVAKATLPRLVDRWQRVGATERTTDTATSPGVTTAFNILSFTIPTAFCTSGRRFRITYAGHVQGNTAGTFCDVQLKLGVNAATGGTQIDGDYVSTHTAARTMPFAKTVEYVYGSVGEADGASPLNLVVVGVPNAGSYFGFANSTRKAGLYVDVLTT